MRCICPLSLLLLLLTSCQGGRVRLASGTVINPPRQAEQPTQVSESKQSSSLALPAGSTITVSHIPASPNAPETTLTTYTLSKDSTQSVQASSQTVSLSPTRKPDTTVELHKADLAERRILLYASIACLVVGIVAKSMLPQWPGASTTAWIASAILFGAWKFSEVPWWAAVCVAVIYLVIVMGYKRAEVDHRKDPAT